MPHNPKKYFSIIAIILTAALSTLVLYFTKLNLLYSYLISINIITFLIYGYDKNQAKKIGNRVPEVVLQLLALLGGMLGMQLLITLPIILPKSPVLPMTVQTIDNG